MKDLLTTRIPRLQSRGFEVLYDELPVDAEWTYSAASAEIRASALTLALKETASDFVLCARGGYGASDLLPLLPWPELGRVRPKLVVGFSDISAIHSALYSRLGWFGLHGPMPATVLWEEGENASAYDIDALCTNLTHWKQGRSSGSIPLKRIGHGSESRILGKLFGGCFTVITNLIGTPFFPKSLADHIIFIEDTDEHPARLMRALNQWVQSGAFLGARALIIGHLRNLGPQIPDCAEFVLEQFAKRLDIPVFHSPLFGHTQPNYPLMIGADAIIESDRLSWEASTQLQPLATSRSAFT